MSERLLKIDLYEEIVSLAQWDTEDLLNNGEAHWRTLIELEDGDFDPNERRPVVLANGSAGPSLPVLAAFAMNLSSQKWEQIEEAHPFFERVVQWLIDKGADPALGEAGLTADKLAPAYLKRLLMEARGEPFEWHEQLGLLETTAKRLNTGNLTFTLFKELDKRQSPLGLPMGFGCILADFPQALMDASRFVGPSQAEKNQALNVLRARAGWWKKAIERAAFQAPEYALELRAVVGFMALALVTIQPQPEGKVVWQSLLKPLRESLPQGMALKPDMEQAMERAMDGRLGPLTPLVCQVMANPFPPTHTPAASTLLAAALRVALTRQDWAQWSDQADLPAVSGHTERLVKKLANLDDVPKATSRQAQHWMAQLPVDRGSVLLLQLAVFREHDSRNADNPWLPWVGAWMEMHPDTRRGMAGLFSRLHPHPMEEQPFESFRRTQAAVRVMAMEALLETDADPGRSPSRPRM